MEQKYIDTAKILKAISDPKRLRIVDMLSCGELCACVIQQAFSITQPTLSHDMHVLLDAGIVTARKEWKRTYYSLDLPVLEAFLGSLSDMFHPASNCICRGYRRSVDEAGCCRHLVEEAERFQKSWEETVRRSNSSGEDACCRNESCADSCCCHKSSADAVRGKKPSKVASHGKKSSAGVSRGKKSSGVASRRRKSSEGPESSKSALSHEDS